MEEIAVYSNPIKTFFFFRNRIKYIILILLRNVPGTPDIVIRVPPFLGMVLGVYEKTLRESCMLQGRCWAWSL